MYDASISWRLLQDVLDSLTSQGFVEAYDVKHLRDKRSSVGYRLTQKGENVVSYFKETMKARHALYAEHEISRLYSQLIT
jgi:predicted transcriptional regulator